MGLISFRNSVAKFLIRKVISLPVLIFKGICSIRRICDNTDHQPKWKSIQAFVRNSWVG